MRYLGAAADIATGTTNPGSGNIFSGGLPDAPQAGDIVLLAASDDVAFPATPSGFTSLLTVSETTQWNVYMRVSYRILTGPWTGVTSGGNGWVITCWRGVDKTTPFDVTSTTAQHVGTVQADPPSITPTTAGAVILVFGAAHQNTAPAFSSWSTLSGITTDAGLGGGYGGLVGGAYYDGWVSGAYNPPAWVATGGAGSRDAVSASIALRPAT